MNNNNWKWGGPREVGISQSMITKFLTCPYRFYLYYGLGLEEPKPVEPALIWGNMMHKALEHLLPYDQSIKESLANPEFYTFIKNEISKEIDKNIHDSVNYVHSVLNMILLYDDTTYIQKPIKTEVEFQDVHSTGNNNVLLIGKRDGMQSNALVEHKTKGRWDPIEGKKELPLDVQLSYYCLYTDYEQVIYDVILIPDLAWSPPQKRSGEPILGYYNRIYNTHVANNYPINRHKYYWVNQYLIPLPKKKQHKLFKETINPIIDRICELYDYCNSSDFHVEKFNHIFYKMPLRHFTAGATEQYKGDYREHLLGNLDLCDLKPVTKLFKELANVSN